MSEHVNELYDKEGNLIGCLLSAEAWNYVKKDIQASRGIEVEPSVVEIKEPISDWETLKEYWDYPYPVDTDVHCEHCDTSTEDWAADEPRKFHLTAANLAGLVAFSCVNCKSKIVKKHFKDEIRTECTPFQKEKDQSKEARY